jgi:hypothetical protein
MSVMETIVIKAGVPEASAKAFSNVLGKHKPINFLCDGVVLVSTLTMRIQPAHSRTKALV